MIVIRVQHVEGGKYLNSELYMYATGSKLRTAIEAFEGV